MIFMGQEKTQEQDYAEVCHGVGLSCVGCRRRLGVQGAWLLEEKEMIYGLAAVSSSPAPPPSGTIIVVIERGWLPADEWVHLPMRFGYLWWCVEPSKAGLLRGCPSQLLDRFHAFREPGSETSGLGRWRP